MLFLIFIPDALCYFKLSNVTYFEISPSRQTAQATRVSCTCAIQHTDVCTVSARKGDAKKLTGNHRREGDYNIKKGL